MSFYKYTIHYNANRIVNNVTRTPGTALLAQHDAQAIKVESNYNSKQNYRDANISDKYNKGK